MGHHRYHPNRTIPIRRPDPALTRFYKTALRTDHWRPTCRAECDLIVEACPWCEEPTAMVLTGAPPRGLERQAQLACPSCGREVEYFAGGGRDDRRFTRHVNGTTPQRLGTAPGDIHPEEMAHFRPCVFSSCRHHLYLDVNGSGGIIINFPSNHLAELHDTCALDVAARGEHTLDEVGHAMNLTRERIRQIETGALARFPHIMLQYMYREGYEGEP